MSGTIGYDEFRATTVRQVAQLVARRRDHRPQIRRPARSDLHAEPLIVMRSSYLMYRFIHG